MPTPLYHPYSILMKSLFYFFFPFSVRDISDLLFSLSERRMSIYTTQQHLNKKASYQVLSREEGRPAPPSPLQKQRNLFGHRLIYQRLRVFEHCISKSKIQHASTVLLSCQQIGVQSLTKKILFLAIQLRKIPLDARPQAKFYQNNIDL